MRACLHNRNVDARYHQRRVKVEHVEENVKELRANTAKAEERVAAVVEAQQEVALGRTTLWWPRDEYMCNQWLEKSRTRR